MLVNLINIINNLIKVIMLHLENKTKGETEYEKQRNKQPGTNTCIRGGYRGDLCGADDGVPADQLWTDPVSDL